MTPESAGWQRCGLRVVRLAPRSGARRSRAATTSSRCCRSPAAPARSRSRAGASSSTGRESVFARITDWAYVPIDAELRLSSAAGCELALASARATAPLRSGLRRGRRRADRAARRRARDPAGRQLHGARGLRRRRPADLLRAADSRRQLVELSAAQARRDARVRGGQRGDLLLPRRAPRTGSRTPPTASPCTAPTATTARSTRP